MYQYIHREPIKGSDCLATGILEDNEGKRETVSFFLERDRNGFLVRYQGRPILVELDWRNCVRIVGPYPGELCLMPVVPAFCGAMTNWFHKGASEEFKTIVQKIFSLDWQESA